MTVNDLQTMFNLVQEMIIEHDKTPQMYLYERTDGKMCFAVFDNPSLVDLDRAPDVKCWLQLHPGCMFSTPSGFDQVLGVF